MVCSPLIINISYIFKMYELGKNNSNLLFGAIIRDNNNEYAIIYLYKLRV